jgi:hypothetical protein
MFVYILQLHLVLGLCTHDLVCFKKVGTNYENYCNNVNRCQWRFIVVSVIICGPVIFLVILKIDYEQYRAKTIRYRR